MLIGICGKSGTGKSSIVKEMQKLGYKKVITDTTRPPRVGEENGVDYYFDTNEEFDEILNDGNFIEVTSYTVANGELWRYGTSRVQLQEAGENAVIILNPDGVKAFREQVIPITIVYVESNEDIILRRLKLRGDSVDEIERRMKADNEDFADISEYTDITVFNEALTNLKDLAKVIITLAED